MATGPRPGPGILAGLGALIDQSLLGQEEHPGAPASGGAGPGPADTTRYVMLETVREYAAERLARSAEEATVRRPPPAYYGALARRIEPQLYGPHEAAWFARLAQEQRNFRLALRWAWRSRPRATVCAWRLPCGASGTCAATGSRRGSGRRPCWPCPARRRPRRSAPTGSGCGASWLDAPRPAARPAGPGGEPRPGPGGGRSGGHGQRPLRPRRGGARARSRRRRWPSPPRPSPSGATWATGPSSPGPSPRRASSSATRASWPRPAGCCRRPGPLPRPGLRRRRRLGPGRAGDDRPRRRRPRAARRPTSRRAARRYEVLDGALAISPPPG